MSARRWVLLAALLLAPWLAQAATAVFYQPQTRDRELAAAQWPGWFAQLRARGFDTLVVQWTQYGDAFADPAGHAWLLQRVREARAAGLRIVLGLHSDPAFFQRQEMPATALDDYLRTLARQDAEAARRWIGELGDEAIAGWYLPMEIDDRRWRAPPARASWIGWRRGRCSSALSLPGIWRRRRMRSWWPTCARAGCRRGCRMARAPGA